MAAVKPVLGAVENEGVRRCGGMSGRRGEKGGGASRERLVCAGATAGEGGCEARWAAGGREAHTAGAAPGGRTAAGRPGCGGARARCRGGWANFRGSGRRGRRACNPPGGAHGDRSRSLICSHSVASVVAQNIFWGCSGFYPWLECAAACRESGISRKTLLEKNNRQLRRNAHGRLIRRPRWSGDTC